VGEEQCMFCIASVIVKSTIKSSVSCTTSVIISLAKSVKYFFKTF